LMQAKFFGITQHGWSRSARSQYHFYACFLCLSYGRFILFEIRWSSVNKVSSMSNTNILYFIGDKYFVKSRLLCSGNRFE
jgi:hypothetical protein